MCMNGSFMKEAFLFNGDPGMVGIYPGFTGFNIPEALKQHTGSNHVDNKSGHKRVHYHTENAHQASFPFHTTHSTNFQLPIPHHTHHCEYSQCSDPIFSFIPCTDPPLIWLYTIIYRYPCSFIPIAGLFHIHFIPLIPTPLPTSLNLNYPSCSLPISHFHLNSCFCPMHAISLQYPVYPLFSLPLFSI